MRLVQSCHRYKIGCSVETPGFNGLLHGELEALHWHKIYGRVRPKTTGDVVGCRGARLSERSFPDKWKV